MPFMRRFGRPGLLGLAARTAVVAGTATAVSGGLMRRQQRRAQSDYEAEQYEAATQQIVDPRPLPVDQNAVQPPAQQGAGNTDIVTELQKLASLKDSGALSEAEFQAAKSQLLG